MTLGETNSPAGTSGAVSGARGSVGALAQQAAQQDDEGVQLALAEGGEEGPLDGVLLAVCRRKSRFALSLIHI